jgi:hypothetical protein
MKESSEEATSSQGATAMACTISYHSPISYAAFQMSPIVQR